MTMHGAKGLSCRVVFIPGLEEHMLPGSKRLHILVSCLRQHAS
ncbi:hypothetical protein [Pedosphaera parvula]